MGLEQRRIVVIVSGGIAAYKSADLVSRLRKAGAEVRVVMTDAASKFVAPLTFEALSGHPVYERVFDQPVAWEMEHISWARWAEGIVAAPATANLIAKLAVGLADDAATTLVLAYQGPLWVAPAMNTAMWVHPATQQNIETLRHRGVHIITPDAGPLACGETGPGRMAEPARIVAALEEELVLHSPVGLSGVTAGGEALQQVLAQRDVEMPGMGIDPAIALAGKTVLITAGPTREALDPIRFISNRSSGRMGCALAVEALRRGARVVLVHGPLEVAPPAGVELVPADSARAMLAAVQSRWGEVDLAIFAAAVANYELPAAGGQKLKGGERLTLELTRTPDIAAWCGAHRRAGQVLVGFCAESENLLAAARGKLERKKLDAICANPIGRPGVGFAAEENEITMLFKDGNDVALPRGGKRDLAGRILDEVGKG